MVLAENQKPRVLVLFGGESGEHGISCATAAAVVEAILDLNMELSPCVGVVGFSRWFGWKPAGHGSRPE